MFCQITAKYEIYMKLWNPCPDENYTTRMEKILKFECSDGFRIIATLQEYFSYKDVSFAALPLFYTVKNNDRNFDSRKFNNHIIEIHSLWYDRGLEAELKHFMDTNLGILTEDKLRPTFKLTALPKIILWNKGMMLDISDHQEYNTVCLTVKRKLAKVSENDYVSYNTVWMYRDVNIYNANGKYCENLNMWDRTLDNCDLILVKNDKLRKVYSELEWDEDLPDQINIWEYGIGYKIFRSKYHQILMNLSIFYDRQTDSCYLLCERYYYDDEFENIKQMLDQIIKFYNNRTIKVKAPTLKLLFNNYKGLNK